MPLKFQDIKQIKIKNYSYELSENRIAKYPLAERDSSKLLVYKQGNISEDTFRNIEKYIPENSLLIFNNTKVIQARIHFQNSTGGRIEIFCLEPAEENSEPVSAMNQNKSVKWKCLVGRISKWKESVLTLQTSKFILKAEIIKRDRNIYVIEFSWQPESLSFAEILESIGGMPIPPYLNRECEQIDVSRYQTVYAKQKGSVAAPTAGLHFTQTTIDSLLAKGIESDYVTLHVGAGTFKPVKSETMQDHEMHSEWIDVTIEAIENILLVLNESELKRKIIAIGTTSLRTLESLYWMGIKANENTNSTLHDLEIKQWNPYEMQDALTVTDSLNSLLGWMRQNKMQRLVCKTQIIIVPSYKLKVVDALITNFHQPNSTLLLLVAAVTGDNWRTIYNYALENDFRFLSYGDGSLLFNDNKSEIPAQK